MMWLYHENWLHSPLSLCLHLHKCLRGVSFTPVPPPARDRQMVARKMRYSLCRNASAFFFIPKTASAMDFFFIETISTRLHFFICVYVYMILMLNPRSTDDLKRSSEFPV